MEEYINKLIERHDRTILLDMMNREPTEEELKELRCNETAWHRCVYFAYQHRLIDDAQQLLQRLN